MGPNGEIRNQECKSYVMSIRERGAGEEICIYEDNYESHQRWDLVTVGTQLDLPEEGPATDTPPPAPTLRS